MEQIAQQIRFKTQDAYSEASHFAHSNGSCEGRKDARSMSFQEKRGDRHIKYDMIWYLPLVWFQLLFHMFLLQPT